MKLQNIILVCMIDMTTTEKLTIKLTEDKILNIDEHTLMTNSLTEITEEMKTKKEVILQTGTTTI